MGGQGSPKGSRRAGSSKYTAKSPQLPPIDTKNSVPMLQRYGTKVAMAAAMRTSGKGSKEPKKSAAELALAFKRERDAQVRAFKPRAGSRLSYEQRQVACAAFFAMDLDGSGSIEDHELDALFKSLGQDPTREELEAMILKADHNGDGKIQLREFLDLFADSLSAHTAFELEVNDMRELLHAMGEGDQITKSKLINLLREHYDLDIDLDAIMTEAFKKGVGRLEEAAAMMDDTLTLSELTRVLLDAPPPIDPAHA